MDHWIKAYKVSLRKKELYKEKLKELKKKRDYSDERERKIKALQYLINQQ